MAVSGVKGLNPSVIAVQGNKEQGLALSAKGICTMELRSLDELPHLGPVLGIPKCHNSSSPQ